MPPNPTTPVPPPDISAVYFKYNASIKTFTNWLAHTATLAGGDVKLLGEIAKSITSGDTAAQTYVIAIKDLTKLAKAIHSAAVNVPAEIIKTLEDVIEWRGHLNEWYKSIADINANEQEKDAVTQQAQNFILVLKVVSKLLTPLVITTSNGSNDAPSSSHPSTHPAAALQLVNADAAATHSYVFQPLPSDSTLAIQAFISTCIHTRATLTSIWTAYKNREQSLLVAATVTESALTHLRTLNNELIKDFPELDDKSFDQFRSFLRTIRGSQDMQKGGRMRDEVGGLVVPEMMLDYFMAWLLKSASSESNTASSKTSKTSKTKTKSKTFTGKEKPETTKATAYLKSLDSSDADTRTGALGIRTLHVMALYAKKKFLANVARYLAKDKQDAVGEDKKDSWVDQHVLLKVMEDILLLKGLSAWGSVAVCVFRDINGVMREEAMNGLAGLRRGCMCMLESTAEYEGYLGKGEGEREEGVRGIWAEFRREVGDMMTIDPIANSAQIPESAEDAEKKGTEAMEVLRYNPWLAGLAMLRISTQFHACAAAVTLTSTSPIITVIHLYNAILHSGLLDPKFTWPDLEQIITQVGEESIFGGGRPMNAQSCASQLVELQATQHSIKALSRLASHAGRWVKKRGQYQWSSSRFDVRDICEHLTTSSSQHAHDPEQTVAVDKKLQVLTESLEHEEWLLNFDLLALHRRCADLLCTISAHCIREFPGIYTSQDASESGDVRTIVATMLKEIAKVGARETLGYEFAAGKMREVAETQGGVEVEKMEERRIPKLENMKELERILKGLKMAGCSEQVKNEEDGAESQVQGDGEGREGEGKDGEASKKKTTKKRGKKKKGGKSEGGEIEDDKDEVGQNEHGGKDVI